MFTRGCIRKYTKYEWINNMKITKQQLKQIIKEELRDYYGGESHPQTKADAAMPRRYDDDELPFDDTNKFVKAYNMISDAVKSGTLPESVEDAVFDMLGKLGINL